MTTNPSTPVGQSAGPIGRTSGFPVSDPLPDGDPSSWTPGQLQHFGLPPKPDATVHPNLYQAWLEIFARTLNFVRYEGYDISGISCVQQAISDPTLTGPVEVAATRFATSPNWSGAYLNAAAGRRLYQIYGQWTVPYVSRPINGRAPEYQLATWIGLDGQRRYIHSTLPQVGILQTLPGHDGEEKKNAACAWTQWWAHEDPDTEPVGIKHFAVQSGNKIAAVLTVLTEHAVLCNVVNLSTNPATMVAVHVQAPPIVNAPQSTDGSRPQYGISGATAAWVLERPAVIGSDNALEGFPEYEPTTFTSCIAAEAGGTPSASFERTLGTARFIRMYETSWNPPRTGFISMPARINDTAFEVKHGDFWR